MFDHLHYVPILKSKAAEFGALQDLASEVKPRITPLIEVTDAPWDFENDCPATSLEDHLSKVPEKILKSWGTYRQLFIDSQLIPEIECGKNKVLSITYLLDRIRAKSLQAIPVTGLNRSPDHQQAIKQASKRTLSGVCIRLENDDFTEPFELQERLEHLISFLEVPVSDADLLLDFKGLSQNSKAPTLLAVMSLMAALPSINEWRTFTFSGSAFPLDLRDVKHNESPATVERIEWLVWLTLAQRRNRIPRLPTFGDYAINHPLPEERDPREIKMSANLRYASDNEWVIFKSRNVRQHGYEQFNDLCRMMIQHPAYCGPAFSWGDDYINKCAVNADGPGNAQTWRKVGFTHHITMVTQQIASLFGL